MKIKNVIKCTGFILGLLIMLSAMSGVFKRQDGLYVYDSNAVNTKAAEIDAEPDNTIDTLFMGDSLCYSSFSPLHMWAEYGYTSYVCATSAQRLCDTYAILTEALKTQSPKAVVLETNCLYRSISSNSDTNDKVLDELTEHFDVFAYHSDWKYAAGEYLLHASGDKRAAMKGFVLRKNINPYLGRCYMVESEKINSMEQDIIVYLDSINKLCSENGAVLLLVSTPSPKNWNFEKHNGVMQWAQERGVTYIDLNLISEIGIDWETDTKDGGDHLNITGAKKVTNYIGSILGELCDIQDTRSNPEYKDWETYSSDLE